MSVEKNNDLDESIVKFLDINVTVSMIIFIVMIYGQRVLLTYWIKQMDNNAEKATISDHEMGIYYQLISVLDDSYEVRRRSPLCVKGEK